MTGRVIKIRVRSEGDLLRLRWDVEALHAAFKQSREGKGAGAGAGWGGWGFSLCPLQGAARDLNCDLWEPELCCYFSWNSGYC